MLTLGATFRVDPGGGADFTEIQPAIDTAADGDTVLVARGEYVITEPINFNRLYSAGEIDSPPLKNIVVRSEASAEETEIRMADLPAEPGAMRARPSCARGVRIVLWSTLVSKVKMCGQGRIT